MKTWVKVLIVCASGAAVWGFSYVGTLYPNYALVTSSFASGVAAGCAILTGFNGSKT